MPSGQFAAKCAAVVHGEQWRMIVGGGVDPESGETGEQIVLGRWHVRFRPVSACAAFNGLARCLHIPAHALDSVARGQQWQPAKQRDRAQAANAASANVQRQKSRSVNLKSPTLRQPEPPYYHT